ncbi:hypothetical protein [Erythrobacter litoralis]|uniref:Uncharacterized protein n=1 Tax=Erythrobacter litoralis (strain HTCC2594) TaxID=314225 RepID=Q2NB09_ERYLH|nr:hypothetical protein [Erythrobacter litoralis]ABC63132.1 hypothetical protein ELI_05200 [Erythrobacter litoralis HTCC2594]
MSGERIEHAVQRIEQALARIADIADKPTGQTASQQGDPAVGMPPTVSQLVVRHEELRETVAAEIKRLDDIIGKVEK